MLNTFRVKVCVAEIIEHPNGIYSVIFDIPKKYTRFKAGQFMHLTLDEFDPILGYWPESRVFSICTRPKSDTIGIVYSVKGVYTQRMEKELVVGKEVWVKLPFGDFVVDEHITTDEVAVFIAGGTGISPYIPYLQNQLEKKDTRIELFYGVRHPDMILFKNVLADCSMADNITLQVYSEEISKINIEWNIQQGALSIERLWRNEYNHNSYKFFLSGPPAMITYFKDALVNKGVNSDRIFIDDWE